MRNETKEIHKVKKTTCQYFITWTSITYAHKKHVQD